jgi:hypothetical protein
MAEYRMRPTTGQRNIENRASRHVEAEGLTGSPQQVLLRRKPWGHLTFRKVECPCFSASKGYKTEWEARTNAFQRTKLLLDGTQDLTQRLAPEKI